MTAVPRHVRFENEDVDAVRMMVRSHADPPTFEPGTPVEVEVGARWRTHGGHAERVAGHWLDCVVVAESSRELVVRLVE